VVQGMSEFGEARNVKCPHCGEPFCTCEGPLCDCMEPIEPTDEEIQCLKESCCEACEGLWFFDERGCYDDCEDFVKQLKELREESP